MSDKKLPDSGTLLEALETGRDYANRALALHRLNYGSDAEVECYKRYSIDRLNILGDIAMFTRVRRELIEDLKI